MPGDSRRLAVLASLCLLAVVSTGLVGVGTPASPTTDTAQADELDADSILIDIDLAENGSADWRIEYRYVLDDENETDAFDSLQSDIEENPGTYEDRFESDMRASIDAAENSTGREMAISNVRVEAGTDPIPQANGQHGVVTYRFTWESFAVAEGDTITAGDAIREFYLSPDQRLIVTWPDDYELAESPRPSDDSDGPDRAVWEGELHFGSDEPTITLQRSTDGGNETDGGETGDGDDTTPDSEESGDGLPLGLILAAVFVVGLIGAGGLLALRRSESTEDGTTGESGETAAPATGADGEKSHPPPELMSNEERVLVTLEDNGGRMKQKELAEACDWHASKTSKVVNTLKEDEAIKVFRLGRENILTLPEETLGDLDDRE